MTKDDRDPLDLLKTELNFVEKGGYGRSVKTPWQPTSIFQDSPSCLNMADPERTRPCAECALIDFVPNSARDEDIPCHHIPLNQAGATIDRLEWTENQREIEDTVKSWLRAAIARLEEIRSTQRSA